MTRTNDLALASFALSVGFPLLRVEGPPGRREFVFGREIPEDLIAEFYSGTGMVSAKRVLDSYRGLKVACLNWSKD